MKKSEAIDYIANKLERCHDRYGNLHDFHFVASEILEDLLDLGMLPPKRKIREGKGLGCLWADYKHDWEPEDKHEN